MKVSIDIFLKTLGKVCEEEQSKGCSANCPLYFNEKFEDGSCRCCIPDDPTILRWKPIRDKVKRVILKRIKTGGTDE